MTDCQQVEILLAEDNASDAEMTMRALRKNNFGNHLHWVKDGAEAPDIVFCAGEYAARDPEGAPKLIMLDIKMPKMDGIEVLSRLKEDPHIRTIPVVIMTSSNEERDVVESYRLGVNSYIVEPVAFDAFIETAGKLGLYWMSMNRVMH